MRTATAVLIMAGLAFPGFGGAQQRPVEHPLGVLELVGRDLHEDSLSSIWITEDSPVILIEDFAFVPSLECRLPRNVGGDGENRDLGGEGEGRDLGGEGEGRDIGGEGEGRDVGGDGEGRDIGGEGEGRDVGGDGEGRDIGGAGEGRDVGGDGEGRDIGGAGEGRDVGGDGEGRDIGGEGEGRDIGGEVQVYECRLLPDRSGIRLYDVTAENVRVYDGFQFLPVRDGIVRF